MNPLFDKYFHGELTEAEEERLDRTLKESQDAAWDFGTQAEEQYLKYGLPEPRLPRPGGAGWMSGANPWLLLAVLMGLLWMANHLWKRPPAAAPAAPPASVPAQPPPAKKRAPGPRGHRGEIPPEAAGVKAVGDNLRVVVKRETMGPVAVKVLNADGSAVRWLYDGTLDAGRWAFRWDGRDAGGDLVAPGMYRIQVESEGSVQSREVDIR